MTSDELKRVAKRYLAGRPHVELSVVGRPRAAAPVALDRNAVPASGPPSGFRPPVPQIVTLAGEIPLWVFLRGDLPTVTGSIVITGGASHQQPGQAGLAQLTAGHARRGDRHAIGRADRSGCRIDGGNDQRDLRLGRCLRLIQVSEARPSTRVSISRPTFC